MLRDSLPERLAEIMNGIYLRESPMKNKIHVPFIFADKKTYKRKARIFKVVLLYILMIIIGFLLFVKLV